MNKCLECNGAYASSGLNNQCVLCSAVISVEEGFPLFSPSLAYDSSGFKADYFDELIQLEDANFWFRMRNQLIIWALKHYSTHLDTMFEIGCGTGYVLSGIAEAYPQIQLHGSEILVHGLTHAAKRVPNANLMQMDARQIPFIQEFDNIGIFDVLEHIEEDEIVLEQIHNALKPNGTLFMTVPQHPWLWSAVDEHACHVRRYEATDLHAKLQKAGFVIVRSTSFVTSLLPLMFASRCLQKKSVPAKELNAGLKINPLLNYIFEKMLQAEIALIQRGINLPIGGSRLIVARAVSP